MNLDHFGKLLGLSEQDVPLLIEVGCLRFGLLQALTQIVVRLQIEVDAPRLGTDERVIFFREVSELVGLSLVRVAHGGKMTHETYVGQG